MPVQLTLDFHTGAFATRWNKVEASAAADHPSVAAKPAETAIHLKVSAAGGRMRHAPALVLLPWTFHHD